MRSLAEIRHLLKRVDIDLFDKKFNIRCEVDNKYDAGRIFLQIVYKARCNKSGDEQIWHGRKFYLSDHMTDDEIIKTSFGAFKAAIEHEVMEAFRVDKIVLFNPHINFEELLKISNKEIKRADKLDNIIKQ